MPILGFSHSWASKLKADSFLKLRFGDRRGFTLIETLVSIGVLVILSGIMISYGRSASKSLSLASQEAALLNIAFHAKSLSQTFNISGVPTGEQVCSYGIQVDQNPLVVKGVDYNGRVFVFRDMVPVAGDCDADANNQYGNAEGVEEQLLGPSGAPSNKPSDIFYLDSSFSFDSATDLNYVVFIPPDPKVLINNDPAVKQASVFIKSDLDSNLKFEIQVNSFGQITVQ